MEKYKLYLIDLVTLLKERIEQATATESDRYNKGITMGIYEALDLIKSQAQAFDISLEEIGLDDFNLEQFLNK